MKGVTAVRRRRPIGFTTIEVRLDFHEPFLAARIVIAAGDFDEALKHLDEAAQHTGLPPCANDIANARPIAPTRVAELAALRGACLLAKNETDPEGRRLVKDSLQTWAALSDNLNGQDRAQFEKQFGAWRSLVEQNVKSRQ